MRPPQRRRKPTKRSSDGQVAEKRQKTADGQAKRIEPRRGESSHAAPNHVAGHDGSQRNTASASNSDANALAGDAAADSMARHVIPERPDGDLRQNAQVPESTRQFDLAGSNPPCEGMVYQRTDNRPSSAADDYQSRQRIGLSFPGPGPSHMSTGMFSTSSNVVHNNQLGEGEMLEQLEDYKYISCQHTLQVYVLPIFR